MNLNNDGAGDRAKVTRVLADGAYDSRSNFSYLSKKGIDPVIKVRKNSSRKARGCLQGSCQWLGSLMTMEDGRKIMDMG